MKESEKMAVIEEARQRAANNDLELWHDDEKIGWATTKERENWTIKSRDFRLWVTATLFDILNGPPPESLVQRTLREFEMWAVHKCPKYETYIRLARPDGVLYVDLADAPRQAAAIQGGQISIVSPDLKFIRPKGLDALPLPLPAADGANLDNLLLDRLNLRDEQRLLFLAWLTNCLRPSGPYPVLVMSGVQGSGKSTLTRVARDLVDPSAAKLTSLPRSGRDLSIAASHSHLLAFDNVSRLSAKTSDDFCRMSTGGAFRTRSLWTNKDETILKFCRPVIMNGIENLILRSDLLDRAILIHMEPIETLERITEEEFWNAFQEHYPQILYLLYRAAGQAYDILPVVQMDSKPRMADFARWGTALEIALGYEAGRFMREYELNRAEANSLALEASPVASLIHDYLLQHDKFSGTAKTLLQELVKYAEAGKEAKQKMVLKHPEFPKSASALSAAIARVEPNLRTLGISVSRTRNGNNKIVTLRMEA